MNIKRRWFQIHLSTAIVLMLVAGGLLGTTVMSRGWPLRFNLELRGDSTFFQTVNLLPNLAFLLFDAGIPIALGITFYVWLRRREARKP